GLMLFLISSLSMNFGWETAKLLDPFGINIVNTVRLTETPSEINTVMLSVMPFIANRILWISISLVVLSLSFRHFKFAHHYRQQNRFAIFKSGAKKEKHPDHKVSTKKPVKTSGNK